MGEQGSGARGQGSVKPDRITIIVKMTVALSEVPPEQLKEADPVAAMKAWAAEFKADMETDPAFGPFVKVEVGVEEGEES